MSTETISAISFIVFELISTSVLLILAYDKSTRLGILLSGLIQGMLSTMTILSSLGISEWWGYAVGTFLIFLGGIIGMLIGLLIYVSVVRSRSKEQILDVKSI